MWPKVTNAWCRFSDDPPRSRVVLESLAPPARRRLVPLAPTRWRLELEGLSLNMPPGTQEVWDGLVARFVVEEAQPGLVAVTVDLDHPAAARVEVEAEGLPVRTVLALDRTPVHRLLAGRLVALDPAHGGRDAGARGPVNLVEKDVVLEVARRAAAALAAAGARPLLTRDGDEAVAPGERARRAAGAACLVTLHTGHAPGGAAPGTRTLYRPDVPGSRELAACLHRAVLRLGRRPDRGLGRLEAGAPRPPLPAACVELVSLPHPLEEAWLRSTTFKERLARAIVNGVKDYFAARAGDGEPAPGAGAGGAAGDAAARAAVSAR